ncbi:hypothetical protein G6F57_023721 [Rhizopus arrhizus]|nr:hypothetical protein G6F57_023721 [Rhizopus arrhizus]
MLDMVGDLRSAHVLRFEASGQRGHGLRQAASRHVGGSDAGRTRRQSGGRASGPGRTDHQRPRSQSDRPKIGRLPFGGVRIP